MRPVERYEIRIRLAPATQLSPSKHPLHCRVHVYRRDEPLPPTAATRGSAFATAGETPVEEQILEAVLLASFITHPALIGRHEGELESLDFLAPGHDALRGLILRHAHEATPETFREKLLAEAGTHLETLFARSHVRSAPPVRNREDAALAGFCVAEALAKLEARRGARREIEDAMEDLTGLADEGLTWRLSKAAEALHGTGRSSLEAASETGEDRAALSRHLQNLIDARVWEKKRL